MVLFAQAAASAGIWVVQVLTTLNRLNHGQDVPATVWFVLVVNPVIAIAAAVAAASLLSRPWARPLAIAVEVVGCAGALVSVLTGFRQAGVAIVLAVVVIVLVSRSGAVRPATR